MKKTMVLLVVAFLTLSLTILNVSKIDTKASSGASLSSLITSARADGEGPNNCFFQWKEVRFTWYQDECNYEIETTWTCSTGESECYTGWIYNRMDYCSPSQTGTLWLEFCSK